VDFLLVLLGRLERLLVRSQPASDSTGLLCSEVQGQVLLLFVVLAEVLSRLLVGNGQDTGNGLANSGDSGKLGSSGRGDFLDAESEKLALELIELLGQVGLGF